MFKVAPRTIREIATDEIKVVHDRSHWQPYVLVLGERVGPFLECDVDSVVKGMRAQLETLLAEVSA